MSVRLYYVGPKGVVLIQAPSGLATISVRRRGVPEPTKAEKETATAFAARKARAGVAFVECTEDFARKHTHPNGKDGAASKRWITDEPAASAPVAAEKAGER